MNAYEQRQAARRQRMQDRADRKRSQAQNLYSSAKQRADMIPFGQPILVGHHSERADRQNRERITNTFRKSFEMSKQADELERRANAASNAISSDDPDAVTKLKKKLGELKAAQDLMKKANRLLRKGDVQGLVDLVGQAHADELQKPDFMGRVGFADFQLKNNNANIRRISQRIEDLETRRQAVAAEPVIGDGWEINEDVEDNRVLITFEGKPAAEVRKVLKGHGFKWSPSRGAWVRMLNNAGRYAATRVEDYLKAQA